MQGVGGKYFPSERYPNPLPVHNDVSGSVSPPVGPFAFQGFRQRTGLISPTDFVVLFLLMIWMVP